MAPASNADVYTSAYFALQKYLLGNPKPLNCIRRMQAIDEQKLDTGTIPFGKKKIAMIKDEHCRKM